MMPPIMDYRIISIGALSHHELWNEAVPVRTAHATTTLVRSGDRVILIDPGLPAAAITARLAERAGIAPDAVTDVFLTNFRPAHRGGLAAFPHARWWTSEREREAIGRLLVEHFQEEKEPEAREHLRAEIALLQKVQAAPDQLAPQVDLFPLPGFTPGTCGLILSHVRSTTLIAGDAAPTSEHLEQGRVLRGAFDVEQAQESFREAVEIADVIVPGHDNVILNPIRQR